MVTFQSSRASELYQLLRKDAGTDYGFHKLSEVTLNLSESCNISCKYCFANEGLYANKSKSFMDAAILEDALRKIYKEYPDINTVKLFGGEPMLNFRRILQASQLIDTLWGEGPSRPNLGIVTNLTFLPNEVLELVSLGKLSVTVSLDGTRNTHDLARVDKRGRGTFFRIEKSLEKLLKNEYYPTVEATFSPYHYHEGLTPIDLHTQIEDLLPKSLIILNPSSGYDSDIEFCSSLRRLSYEYARFLVARKNYSSKKIIIKTLSTIINRESSSSYCKVGGKTLSIAANGSVWPCYQTMEFEHTRISNDLEGLSRNTLQVLNIDFSKKDYTECQKCSIKDICRSCVSGTKNGRLIPEFESCSWIIGFYEGILDHIDKDFLATT